MIGPRPRFRGGFLAAGAMLASAPMALAQMLSFDGIYRASPDASCYAADGTGTLRIEDKVFHGRETECRMTNQMDVRGMNGSLFDMVCEGEGTAWAERALVMRSAEGGLILVWNGFAFEYDRCPVRPRPRPVNETVAAN